MTRRLQHVNDASTTLNGAITLGATSITVTDGSVFPAAGDYTISINDEIILVTGRATHVLTVERGYDSTTAAAHDDLDAVDAIVTEDSMSTWSEQSLKTKVIDGVIPERLQLSDGTILTSSDFSQDNWGTSSVVDNTWGGLAVFPQAVASWDFRNLYRTPTAPYTVTAHVQLGAGTATGTTTSVALCGIGWRESSGTKISGGFIRGNNTCSWYNFSSPTAFFSGEGSVPFYYRSHAWLRLTNNSTTLKVECSFDGINFYTINERTIGAGAYVSPDKIGFMTTNGVTTGNRCHQLLAWYEE